MRQAGHSTGSAWVMVGSGRVMVGRPRPCTSLPLRATEVVQAVILQEWFQLVQRMELSELRGHDYIVNLT